MAINNGGPAYPLTSDAVNFANRGFLMQGMTKREVFDGMVMQGLCATTYRYGISEKVAMAIEYAYDLIKQLAEK